jgi:hypothetical protein
MLRLQRPRATRLCNRISRHLCGVAEIWFRLLHPWEVFINRSSPSCRHGNVHPTSMRIPTDLRRLEIHPTSKRIPTDLRRLETGARTDGSTARPGKLGSGCGPTVQLSYDQPFQKQGNSYEFSQIMSINLHIRSSKSFDLRHRRDQSATPYWCLTSTAAQWWDCCFRGSGTYCSSQAERGMYSTSSKTLYFASTKIGGDEMQAFERLLILFLSGILVIDVKYALPSLDPGYNRGRMNGGDHRCHCNAKGCFILLDTWLGDGTRAKLIHPFLSNRRISRFSCRRARALVS